MTRPRITLKIASSLDGRIATAAGESRWITGPEARAEVHRLRASVDAILVGAGTARIDDPKLTVRDAPAPPRPPLRVVLDSRLRLAPTSRLARTISAAPLLVIGATDAPMEAAAALAAVGAEVERAPATSNGLDLAAAFGLLSARGVRTVLAEAGGRLGASLIAGGFVDRLEWVRAPILLGGDGRPAIDSLALAKLSQAPRFTRLAARALGDDVWESYERI
jgi:diaminohydroxyphosphoribosylaminopyrimidine deaminase/5-amino-6-(5-phosphoribosylamino)uracil reductase